MNPKRDYKKSFIYSASIAIIAYSVGLFAIGQGVGTEGLDSFSFAPLLLLEIIATPASLIFGFIYLFRANNPADKLKIGLTLVTITALASMSVIIF